MANRQIHSFKPLPMANYSPAIARAVEWLGDRYLLAKPINAAPKSRDTGSGTRLTAFAALSHAGLPAAASRKNSRGHAAASSAFSDAK